MGILMAFALLCLTAMPGCVVWDIRDEMRTTNSGMNDVRKQLGVVEDRLGSVMERLDKTNEDLERTNQALAGVNTALAGTNRKLAQVETGLERLDATNGSLTGLQRQLNLLEQINSSMGKLDGHLASLRKSLGGLNSMLPFFDIGGDALPASGETTAPAQAAAGDGEPAAGAGAGGAAAAGTPAAGLPPSAIHGPWVSAYPDRNQVLLLKPDGVMIQSSVDRSVPNLAPQTQVGTWKREGNRLKLSWTVEKTAPGPVPAGSPPGTPAPMITKTETIVSDFEIANQTSRSLTLMYGGRAVTVYGRP